MKTTVEQRAEWRREDEAAIHDKAHAPFVGMIAMERRDLLDDLDADTELLVEVMSSCGYRMPGPLWERVIARLKAADAPVPGKE